MAITLTSGATVIELPEDLEWVDELTSWAVAQSEEYSLTGALIIQRSKRLAGRPITLQSGGNFGWATRETIEALKALDELAESTPMTLEMSIYPTGTQTFSVQFRRGESPAIESAQRKHRLPPTPDEYCSLVLRLIEV